MTSHMVVNAVKELQSAKQQIAGTISGLEKKAKQIDQAIAVLSGLSNGGMVANPVKKSTMSAATIAKMRLAAKACWVKHRAAQDKPATPVAKPAKKGPSAAGIARIKAAQKARWTKIQAAKVTFANPATKRTMSAAARKKLSEFQKKLWAERKAAKVAQNQ